MSRALRPLSSPVARRGGALSVAILLSVTTAFAQESWEPAHLTPTTTLGVPELANPRAVDPSPCAADIEVFWDAFEPPMPDAVFYHVYRSTGADASCDDALTRAPVVSDLMMPGWRDVATMPGERHAYVIEAETAADGVVARSCLAPTIDYLLMPGEVGTGPVTASCNGESITLEAADLVFLECSGRSYTWFDEMGRVVSRSFQLPVTPEETTTYEVTVTCDDVPGCSATFLYEVIVAPLPLMGTGFAIDTDSCEAGLLIRWTRAVFSDPMLLGVYHVHRSDADPPTCEDALANEPIVMGLTDNAYVDTTTIPGREHVYVVVAEDAGTASTECGSGPMFGGTTDEACLDAVVDVAAPFPEGVDDTLRVAHVGEEITVDWAGARALLDGEGFVLLKTLDDPTSPFAPVLLPDPMDRSFTETDTSSPIQFFDLRVESCRGLSLDEYPPGP
ncbi:MAG: hypothetical protein AAF533_14160 [Acidobacteriota bacterium]